MASKKEIIVKDKDLSKVVEKQRTVSGNSYKVFEIPKGQGIGFRLLATEGTINVKETQERVYWVAQAAMKFKQGAGDEKPFLPWKSGAADMPLHEFLDFLDREKGKWRDKGVGVNYIRSFDIKNGEFIYKSKQTISYNGNVEGKGIWLEACNYYPEYKSQGAFLIPVAPPYIKAAVVNEMTGQEMLCAYDGKLQELQGKLHYGDYMEIIIQTHNILPEDFTGTITINCEGTTLEVLTLTEADVIAQFEGTPAYNATYIRQKVYLDLKWIEKLNHKEDSSKNYNFIIAFKAKDSKSFKYPIDSSKVKIEIQKEVFYEDVWSFNEEEAKAIPQIAQIDESQVVTMEFEECRFTKLAVSHDIEKTDDAGKKTTEKREYTILEETDGCLSTNENVPTFAVIAGDKNNKPKIEVAISGLDRANCESGHKNAKISIINDGEVTEKSLSDGDTKVNFKADYDYPERDLVNKLTQVVWAPFLSPKKKLIHIATCRYTRPLSVSIYPNVEWTVNIKFNTENPAYVKQNPTYKKREVELKEFYNRNKNLAYGRERNLSKKASPYNLQVEIKCVVNGKEQTIEISAVNRIFKLINIFLWAYEAFDQIICGSKSKEVEKDVKSGRLKGKTNVLSRIGRGLPIRFDIARPSFSGGLNWKLEYSNDMSNPHLGMLYTLVFRSDPLLSATGRLDLIFFAQFIPIVGQVIAGINKVIDVINIISFGAVEIDYYIDFVVYGKLSFNIAEVSYHTRDKKWSGKSPSFNSEVEMGIDVGGKVAVDTWMISGEAVLSGKARAKFVLKGRYDSQSDKKNIEFVFDGFQIKVEAYIKRSRRNGRSKKPKNNDPIKFLEGLKTEFEL
ncbi:hypothetical protein [Aquimarina rhabdastrellae]